MSNIILSAFLDGFTGGSPFTRLRRPGAPSQLFADDEAECSQFALVASLLEGGDATPPERHCAPDFLSIHDVRHTPDGSIDRECSEFFPQSAPVSYRTPQPQETQRAEAPIAFSLAGRKFRIVEEEEVR